jgi:membrane protein YdbS with pleckstrin-like domain
MKRIIIKEGPVVFLRNVILMEFLATIIFVGASYLANYEQLFKYVHFDSLISYNNFIIIVFSLFQLIYILALFFDWYLKFYEIREKEIVRHSGLILKKRKSVSLLHIVAVETSQGPLDRILRHATLILEHDNGRVTKIQNVAGYEEYSEIIKQTIDNTIATYYVCPVRFLEERTNGISRAKFVEMLQAEGIPFGQAYVKPLYMLPLFQRKIAFKKGYPWSAPENAESCPSYEAGLCPCAEKLHTKELMLNFYMCHPQTIDDVDDVIAAIQKIAPSVVAR